MKVSCLTGLAGLENPSFYLDPITIQGLFIPAAVMHLNPSMLQHTHVLLSRNYTAIGFCHLFQSVSNAHGRNESIWISNLILSSPVAPGVWKMHARISLWFLNVSENIWFEVKALTLVCYRVVSLRQQIFLSGLRSAPRPTGFLLRNWAVYMQVAKVLWFLLSCCCLLLLFVSPLLWWHMWLQLHVLEPTIFFISAE